MTDELLPYYNKELSYIKRMAGEFAELHPKIASRLRISQAEVEDPHVSRLIEAFAYLNARTRRKLEDDFPELAEGILQVLYPHYLAPFPSCGISRFQLPPAQMELTGGYSIPRGSELETDPIDGEPCRFRTCYETKIWPIRIEQAEFRGPPFAAPKINLEHEARAVIHLQLNGYSSEIPFSSYDFSQPLRLFLNGTSQSIYDLYEFVLNDSLQVVVANSPTDPQPFVLSSDVIRPVGFEIDQGLVDYPARSSLGYRLLSEYFAFPEKFLFLDLDVLTPEVLASKGENAEFHLFIYLKNYSRDVENNLRPDTFQIGCSPMVNLFQHRAEPIHLTPTQFEYRVVPDARRPLANEVYSIDQVIVTDDSNEEKELYPFYSVNHQHEPEQCYWYSSRRNMVSPTDKGTDVFLNLVNLDFSSVGTDEGILDIRTTVLNRDLPERLPIDARYALTDLSELVESSVLVTPTPTRRPIHRDGAVWRLISHLNLNHISLAGNEDGKMVLREMLRLYDFADSAVSRTMIDGILDVQSERVVGRVSGPINGGFCRGTRISVTLDEDKFIGGGLYLFASILDRFFGLYASINSFTRSRFLTPQRGVLFETPPRNGTKLVV